MIIYRARISAALWYMASFILGFLFLNNIEYFLASKLPNYWNKTSSLIKADKTVVKSEVLSRSWLNTLPFPTFLTHHTIYKQGHHQFLCLSHQISPKAFSDTTTILNSVKLFSCFKNKSFITNECISRQYIISSCLISITLKMNPQFRWSPGVAFSRVHYVGETTQVLSNWREFISSAVVSFIFNKRWELQALFILLLASAAFCPPQWISWRLTSSWCNVGVFGLPGRWALLHVWGLLSGTRTTS